MMKMRSLDGQSFEYPDGGPIVTVNQLAERHPALTAPLVRQWIARADFNSDLAGIRDAIIRIGRSIYVDEGKFIRALATNACKPASPPRNPHGRAGKPRAATSRQRR